MAGEDGRFGEHHVIGPDTPVLDGVFMSREGGAIVVDFAENPQLYEIGYRSVENRLSHGRVQPPPPIAVARIVNQVVKEMVPYEWERAQDILGGEAEARGLEAIGPADEVQLSWFVGSGNCHHQTLFGASLLSLLQERQDIGGVVSVQTEPPEIVPGATRQHTWTRYTNGKRIIIDSALHKRPLFTLEELETPIEPRRRIFLTAEELREFVADDDLTPDDIRRLVAHGSMEPDAPQAVSSAARPFA